MTTPQKSAPKSAVPAKTAPVKATVPAFNLDSLAAVKDTAPRRNDTGNQVPEGVLRALRDSWDERTELTKARDAVPAKDGKPARPAVKATYLGGGRAFHGLPNEDAVKTVEALLRKGATQVGVGVSIRSEKSEDGKSFSVRFAAKTLKSKST